MSNLAAVIIDNRPISQDIIANHLKHLPEYTKLYVLKPNIVVFPKDYNNLLATRSFWQQFEEENILIFQQDTGILRNGIEEYYQYDFIGAPIDPNRCAGWKSTPSMNGGLSLRKKSAMIKCLEKFQYDVHSDNEDIFFCKSLYKLSANLPTIEVAKKFSVETMFTLGSFGYHAMHRYLNKNECDLILNQYN